MTPSRRSGWPAVALAIATFFTAGIGICAAETVTLGEPRYAATEHGSFRFDKIEISDNGYACKVTFSIANETEIIVQSGFAKLSFSVTGGDNIDHYYRLVEFKYKSHQEHRSPCMPGLTTKNPVDVSVSLEKVTFGETMDQELKRYEAERAAQLAEEKRAAAEEARIKQINDRRRAKELAEEKERFRIQQQKENAEAAQRKLVDNRNRARCAEARKSWGNIPIGQLTTNQADVIQACKAIGFW